MTTRSSRREQYGVLGTHLVALCVSVLATVLLVSSADAQEERNVAGASEAFSKAQKAELRGDFQEASSFYALADEMAPAAEALRGAARTAQQAGLNATAATHAELLLARESDPASRAQAEEILQGTKDQLARLHITCDAPCKVLIDGRVTASRLSLDQVLYARPGERSVSASFERGNAPGQTRTLSAGASDELSFSAPLPVSLAVATAETAPVVEHKGMHKLSPWYISTVGALAVVAGGLTVWSGLKVNSKHDSYDRSSPTAKADYDDGRKLEKQTNALIGVTGGLVAATAALAFFTDFKRKDTSADKQQTPSASALTMGATRQGAVLGWKASF